MANLLLIIVLVKISLTFCQTSTDTTEEEKNIRSLQVLQSLPEQLREKRRRENCHTSSVKHHRKLRTRKIPWIHANVPKYQNFARVRLELQFTSINSLVTKRENFKSASRNRECKRLRTFYWQQNVWLLVVNLQRASKDDED